MTLLQQALNRISMLENKFRRNPAFKNEYVDFIRDYLKRGHMKALHKQQLIVPKEKCFYLAHHAVLKVESATTKRRVVFDGSGKDITGHSLNDRLHMLVRLVDFSLRALKDLRSLGYCSVIYCFHKNTIYLLE